MKKGNPWPHTRPPRQGKLRPAKCRPLTRRAGEAAAREGDEKA